MVSIDLRAWEEAEVELFELLDLATDEVRGLHPGEAEDVGVAVASLMEKSEEVRSAVEI